MPKIKDKTGLFYFKTNPEIYDRYALGKYKCFVTQLYDFLSNISNNPNCTYSYGNGKKDMLITNTDEIDMEVFNQHLSICRNELVAGFDNEYEYISEDDYLIPLTIDFTSFVIRAVNDKSESTTNKKRAHKLFDNFYNAPNANGLKDFIDRALFKNGINHNFVVTVYNNNEEVIYTYHLADNLEMNIKILIPDVSIKNSDAKYEDYFTTMRIYCSLDVVGYRSCMIGMMNGVV